MPLDVVLKKTLHGGEVLWGQHRGKLMEAKRVPVGHELSLQDVSQVEEVGSSIQD